MLHVADTTMMDAPASPDVIAANQPASNVCVETFHLCHNISFVSLSCTNFMWLIFSLAFGHLGI